MRTGTHAGVVSVSRAVFLEIRLEICCYCFIGFRRFGQLGRNLFRIAEQLPACIKLIYNRKSVRNRNAIHAVRPATAFAFHFISVHLNSRSTFRRRVYPIDSILASS
jgi:hypothetical protein